MLLLCCYIEFQQLLVVSLVAIGLLYTGRWVVRSGVTSKQEVRITLCYSDIACSCMIWWETPEVPCGCYACTECMFAMKSRCKYAGCRRPHKFQHLHACGQPHAASLQVAGPNVCVSVSCKLQVRMYILDFAVWAATRGVTGSAPTLALAAGITHRG